MEKKNFFWVGLANPEGVSCNDSDCSDKLKWQDGSNFTWDPLIHSSIDASQNIHGFSLKVDEKRLYKSNDTDKPYACMSLCVGKSQITLVID